MFSARQRLRIEGVKSPEESDAAMAARGGPDQEVLLGTGELVLTETDVSLPQRGGIGFSLVRYYRSHVDYNGPLGPGWDHNCNQRIVAEVRDGQPERLVWYTGQRAIRFTRQGDEWQPEPGAFYRLRVDGGHIIIETAERIRLEFEPAKERKARTQQWRIARIASRHDQWQANVLRFDYWPGLDVLRRVVDPFGNRVEFIHDKDGRLLAVEFGDLKIVYRYDDFGRLETIMIPRVAVRLAKAEDLTWQYSYVRSLDGRNWLQRAVLPGAEAEKVYEYQLLPSKPGYGRVVTITLRGRDPKTAPQEGRWQFAVTPSDDSYTVAYRPPSPLPEERWEFSVEHGRPNCYPWSRRIDAHSALWRWEHNVAGQLVAEYLPLGGVRRWTYDSDHVDP
jgi:hypothetical protein